MIKFILFLRSISWAAVLTSFLVVASIVSAFTVGNIAVPLSLGISAVAVALLAGKE
jgi:hypothetical protein